MNEAAILAARRHKAVIDRADVDEAVDRVLSGPERKGQAMSARERRIVAYHEAGHALVARALGEGSGVRKVSIVARGASGGQTTILPEEDRRLWSRAQLRAQLACALGGMAAEQLAFGDVTTGSENDLSQATTLAQRMVTSLGMSERLGPVALTALERSGQATAEATAEAYREVSRFTQLAYEQASAVLESNRALLDAVAEALLARDSLSGEQLDEVCRLVDRWQSALGSASGESDTMALPGY
jgi:cell division protease FtsH